MAKISMLFPGGKAKALTLSYDDGIIADSHLIPIMKKYGLKGTFNLSSGLFSKEGQICPEGEIYRRMTIQESIELYSDSGMEIAAHGLTHPVLDRLDKETCTYEIAQDRKQLESYFNRIVQGLAYPFGACSQMVIECAHNSGIVYARTAGSSHNFDLPSNWMLWTGTCHHDDPMLHDLVNKFIIECPQDDPWLFYLWGHSYEFDEKNNWDRIEWFAQTIGGVHNIWYATNIDIYSYVEAYKQMEVFDNEKTIYNPTEYTLYYRVKSTTGWKSDSIQPGQTKTL